MSIIDQLSSSNKFLREQLNPKAKGVRFAQRLWRRHKLDKSSDGYFSNQSLIKGINSYSSLLTELNSIDSLVKELNLFEFTRYIKIIGKTLEFESKFNKNFIRRLIPSLIDLKINCDSLFHLPLFIHVGEKTSDKWHPPKFVWRAYKDINTQSAEILKFKEIYLTSKAAGILQTRKPFQIENKKDLDHVLKLITESSLIPWDAVRDYCNARAFLGCEILIASGLDPEKIYFTYILGELKNNWSYHMALTVEAADGKKWILDPSLSERPLELEEWAKLFQCNSNAQIINVQNNDSYDDKMLSTIVVRYDQHQKKDDFYEKIEIIPIKDIDRSEAYVFLGFNNVKVIAFEKIPFVKDQCINFIKRVDSYVSKERDNLSL